MNTSSSRKASAPLLSCHYMTDALAASVLTCVGAALLSSHISSLGAAAGASYRTPHSDTSKELEAWRNGFAWSHPAASQGFRSETWPISWSVELWHPIIPEGRAGTVFHCVHSCWCGDDVHSRWTGYDLYFMLPRQWIPMTSCGYFVSACVSVSNPHFALT